MARISILIPVYNTEGYLAEAINSVIEQSFEDWELLILDDCSNDESYWIAIEFSNRDKRIKVIRNEKNLGMLNNWNKGISICQCEYFVKLDADDMWHSDFLAESLAIMDKRSDVGMVFTKYVNIDSSGKLIENSESESPDFARDCSFSCEDLVNKGAWAMLQYNILRQGMSLIRRKIFDEIGMYSYLLTPETLACTDTEFYFRVGCHYPIYVINKCLYYYRLHDKSISAKDSNKDLNARKLFEVKISIINYYLEQGKIDNDKWEKSRKDSWFRYNSYLIYKYRITGSYLRMLLLLFKNAYISPIRMLRDNLHLNRYI
jgi:glycosyltransferase involved in cell wall biosynthesis